MKEEKSYQKLFEEYANSSDTITEKYLRHLQNEAGGNSRYRSTMYNLRRAHITNRMLDRRLEHKIKTLTKIHGSNCGSIERQQSQLFDRICKILIPSRKPSYTSTTSSSFTGKAFENSNLSSLKPWRDHMYNNTLGKPLPRGNQGQQLNVKAVELHTKGEGRRRGRNEPRELYHQTYQPTAYKKQGQQRQRWEQLRQEQEGRQDDVRQSPTTTSNPPSLQLPKKTILPFKDEREKEFSAKFQVNFNQEDEQQLDEERVGEEEEDDEEELSDPMKTSRQYQGIPEKHEVKHRLQSIREGDHHEPTQKHRGEDDGGRTSKQSKWLLLKQQRKKFSTSRDYLVHKHNHYEAVKSYSNNLLNSSHSNSEVCLIKKSYDDGERNRTKTVIKTEFNSEYI